jgi:hypothetical protein
MAAAPQAGPGDRPTPAILSLVPSSGPRSSGNEVTHVATPSSENERTHVLPSRRLPAAAPADDPLARFGDELAAKLSESVALRSVPPLSDGGLVARPEALSRPPPTVPSAGLAMPAPPPATPPPRRRWALVAIVAALVMIGAGVAVFLWLSGDVAR